MHRAYPFSLPKTRILGKMEAMKSLCVTVNFGPIADESRPMAGLPPALAVEKAVHLCFPEFAHSQTGPWQNAADLIKDLQALSEGYDEVVLTSADAPLLRSDVCRELLSLHRQYRADYTFADGLPMGLSPEILKPSALILLAHWAPNFPGPVTRETLFSILSTDINRFDVETFLSPVDLRSRRLSLTLDSRRNRVLIDRYFPYRDDPLEVFLKKIDQGGFAQRTLPATLHVQVSNGVIQVPVWSPLLQVQPQAQTQRAALDRRVWNQLLDEAVALCNDVTVMPSLWGEPSLHPQIVDLFSDALSRPSVRLCVETSGIGWKEHALEKLSQNRPGAIDWIVELDSDDEKTYQALRGGGYTEAQDFTRRLLGLFPGNVWPQTVRMHENEPEMDAFYRHWTEEAGRVIIQKYDSFGGLLPERKPSNLAPWKRHACWHVARDLVISLDGTVSVCRDDLNRTLTLGHWPSESLDVLWSSGNELSLRHEAGDLPEVCRVCDEWYTYHF